MATGAPTGTATADLIVYIGAAVGLCGLLVSLFNSWKAVQWKRAELASTYLKELNSNEELVFACRSLEWTGGRLVVPERLVPLMPNQEPAMEHSATALRQAMELDITVGAMAADRRLQIYRTAMDSLLSWMAVLDQALERKLFSPADIQDAAYWVYRVADADFLDGYVRGFGYNRALGNLQRRFARPPALGNPPPAGRRGGFGSSAKGRSAGG